MKKNSNAFVLIKRLTMSEKRYFKIFSERHTIGTQNKYVILFDLLDKLKQEDDTVIRKKVKAQGINADFLSADKNYLYNLVLRSLNDFHDSKTYNLTIKKYLLSIEILFHKGLYKECMALVSKAELIAEECENFELMIDLLMWKKKCCGYSLGVNKAAEINLLIDKYLVLLNNLKRITDLYYKSNLLQSVREKYDWDEINREFKNILSQPELKSDKNALSFSAKIFHYLIYANYYYSIDNKQKEYQCLQKLIDIINSSKTYAIENPLDYISVYNRLLAIKKYFPSPSFFNDIAVLQEFTKKDFMRKDLVVQRVFVHTNTHELEYYLLNNNLHQASVKARDIEKELSKLNFEIEPYHILYFYYVQAIALVFTGGFREALKFVNKALNNFTFNDRPQVYIRIELINAIVHYELQNYSLVLSLARSILRKNVSGKILVPIEINLLNALVKICSMTHMSFKNEADAFQLLIDNELAKNGKEQNNLISNYEKWLHAKVKRKLVCEVFSEDN